jgi:hypothetical protein
MNQHIDAPVKLILLVLSFCLFVIAAAMWWTVPENPHRLRIVAAGLACWVASQFFGG